MKPSKINYEEANTQLQDIINRLQNDQYSMEEIAQAIDKAKSLLLFCEESLRNVQDKIIEIKSNTEL